MIYDSAQSTNCIIKGDNVYPEFIDSVWISQLQVSGTENINPFAVVTHMGAMDLSPQTDEWRETQQAADVIVGGGTVNSFSGNQATLFNSSQWNWAGTQVGATRSQVIGGSLHHLVLYFNNYWNWIRGNWRAKHKNYNY